MPAQPDQQIPLEVSRGALVAMMVVLTVAWFGDGKSSRDDGGFAFGAQTRPEIVPIRDQIIQRPELGVAIHSIENFDFFRVDLSGARQVDPAVSFINRKQKIVGTITAFDPNQDDWPPQAVDFGHTVNFKHNLDHPIAPSTFRVGPQDDFRLQVQAMLYGETQITWASPRKSPAWPLRIHIGKCQVGSRTLKISIYELHAVTPEPDYENGPIADFAAAICPVQEAGTP